jgi:hypothetical protein
VRLIVALGEDYVAKLLLLLSRIAKKSDSIGLNTVAFKR